MSRRLLTAKPPHGASRFLLNNRPGPSLLLAPCRMKSNRSDTSHLARYSRSNWPSGGLKRFSTMHQRQDNQRQEKKPPHEPGPETDTFQLESPMKLFFGAILIACGIYFTGNRTSFDWFSTKDTPPPTTTEITYATHQEMLTTAQKISNALGPDSITYDPDTLDHHGHSPWSTSNSAVRAVAVVYPRSTAEVSLIASLCSSSNVPMIPFGAGSSVEGNFAQPHSGIIVDFTRYMDNIICLNGEDMDVIVQPGVNWVDLNNEIEKQGWRLFAPLDPSPTATIGGMVSTNCSGTNAMRYGTMKDWVVNLTVVLADGRVVKTRRRPRKTSAGYNLTGLFVGAEGTLGMVTEVTLRLAPVPEDTGVAAVAFESVADAAGAAQVLIRSGVQLGALELMDDVQMGILNKYGSERVRRIKWQERGATLFIKFTGTSEGIKGDVGRVREMVKPFVKEGKGEGSKIYFARNKQEEADIWAARKEALFTMVSIKPEGHEMWSTDVAVPISRLAEIIEFSKEECGKLGIFASVIGHVGDGNFHVAMMYDPLKPGQKEAVGKVVKDMMSKALEMDGTVSGEHAIGIGKKKYLIDELGDETTGLMRELKRTVDPKWVMNPGKVFDP